MTVPLLADRVAELWTGTGTGTVTPAGNLIGYQTWGGAFAVGDSVHYVIAHRGLDEFEVGIGTIGSGGTLARDVSVLTSSNAGALVAFSAGEKDVFCAIDANSLMGAVITRLAVAVQTSLLAVGDVWEGSTTDFGRLFRLLSLTVDSGAWVRVYGSAADMAADTRTDPTVAPTTEPVLAEALLFGATLTAAAPAGAHGIGVFIDNTESPQQGRLFVRITRADATGSVAPVSIAIGTEFGNVGGGTQDLDLHTPTQPGSSGLSAFEYAGASTAWYVAGTGQGYPGAYKQDNRSTFAPARTDVDLVNGNLRLLCDVRRLSPLQRGYAGMAWCLNDDAVGAWALENFLYVIVDDATGTRDHTLKLFEVDAGGVHNLLATSASFVIGEQAERRFIVEVVDGSPDQLVNVWLADAGTGLNPVLMLADVAIPDYRDPSRLRVGIVNGSATADYTHSLIAAYVEDLTDPGATAQVTLTAAGDRLAT